MAKSKKEVIVSDKKSNEEAIIECILIEQQWRSNHISDKFSHRELWKIISMKQEELLLFEANTGGLSNDCAEKIAILTANSMVRLMGEGNEVKWKRIKSSHKAPHGAIRLNAKIGKYNNAVGLSCKDRNHQLNHDTVIPFTGPGLDKTN